MCAQCLSLTDDMVQLVSKSIQLEHCTVFRLDIPGRRVMAVRARVSRRLDDVVSPILARAGISYDDVVVHIVCCTVCTSLLSSNAIIRASIDISLLVLTVVIISFLFFITILYHTTIVSYI